MSNFVFLLEKDKGILYANNRVGDKMIYPSIDKLLVEVGSKYYLVNLVSKRAKEIQEKQNFQMKESEYVSKKEIGRALEEVSKKLIHTTTD